MFLGMAALFSGCHPNFHEVDPGKMYRSAQLTGEELEHAINSLGIRSIINLRGESPGAEWYDTEAQVARDHGVKMVSIPMSAKRLPLRRDLIKLVDAMESSPRPMLIHCQAGADRTGEASAMYLMDYMGKTREEALEMLTIKYDHLAFYMPAKRYFIGFYGGKEWARHSYDPCRENYLYFDKSTLCTESGSELPLGFTSPQALESSP